MGVIFFVFISITNIIAGFKEDAPFIRVPEDIEDEIIKSLNLNEDSIVYDLGCGDGKILLKIAERNPSVQIFGVELSVWPYLLAKIKTSKYRNIRITRENMFNTDLSKATTVFAYLYPKAVTSLLIKMKKECGIGTRLVSCDFEADGFTPIETFDLNSVSKKTKRGKKLFIYTI